jgi:MSHA biogenesis protein MshQ
MAVANLACVAAPHHFEVQGPASGSTCANSTFTIKAWADAGQTIAYTTGAATGTLTASGNPASMPSLGAFTIPTGSSTVSITPISFPAAGTSTFTATATPALAGTTTCDFGGSTSCALTVGSCVGDFNCVETTTGGASAADSNSSTGRLYTKRAGTAFSIDVVARKGDGTVDPTYASGANKSVTVELVDGSGVTACDSRTALSSAVSVTQNFVAGDAGRKSFSFTVANAYQNVRCRVNDTTTVPAIAKACSVDNFAIRPSTVTVSTTSANAAAPPAANAATATPMVKAGAGFTLQASTSIIAANNAGTLALDSTKLTAQITTQVTSAAAGGTVGTLTLTPATLTINASPQPTNNATYSEVGYLYLAAGAFYDNTFTAVDSAATPTVINDCVAGSFADTLAGGKYGCNFGNTATVSLGRFVPDHFDTAIVQATAPIACPSGMTCPGSTPMAMGLLYANQPLAMKVTAKNAIGTGGTTTNYQGVFAKANTLSAWSAAGSAGTANPGSGTLASTSVAASSFTAGVASA